MDIKNVSEKFFREIRMVQIYLAEEYPYLQNYLGEKPTVNPAFSFVVVPESFSHKIPTKIKNGSYYYEVDLGFSLNELAPVLRDNLYRELNQKKFAIGLISNVEEIYLGNDRETMTVQITDDLRNNNSGDDQFYISLFGETIIPPKAKNI